MLLSWYLRFSSCCVCFPRVWHWDSRTTSSCECCSRWSTLLRPLQILPLAIPACSSLFRRRDIATTFELRFNSRYQVPVHQTVKAPERLLPSTVRSTSHVVSVSSNFPLFVVFQIDTHTYVPQARLFLKFKDICNIQTFWPLRQWPNNRTLGY